MSKRIIIVPDRYYKDTWYMWIFNRLCKDLNFKLCCWSENIPNNVEIVIVFGFPHFNWRNDIIVNELVNLDSRVRLICWTADLHCGSLVKIVQKCKEDTIRMFDRSDLIISSHDTRMKKEYVKYLDKYVYIPLCFAPHEDYMRFKINEHPRMQCLQVGASSPKVYPLRNRIKKYAGTHNQIQHVEKISQANYPALLHQYFCGIVDVGHNEVLQPKHFEIPAVGSLLLAHRTNLVDDLGFVPYEHYIPFTGDDVFAKANEILSNPVKYEQMRRICMKFVREKHNVDSRMDQTYTAIGGLL